MALNRFGIFFKNFRNWKHCLRYKNYVPKHNFSVCSANKAPEELKDVDSPIKFSSTENSKKTYDEIFGSKKDEAAFPIEKYVILASLFCFFAYFTFLRRRNKFDDILEGNYETSDEEVQLKNALLNAKIRGLKTDEIEKRLQLVRQNNYTLITDN